MDATWRELRRAARTLLRRPGITLPVVLVLALGFGANTMVFSLFYGVLLKPLPFSDPERLVLIWAHHRAQDLREQVSAPDFHDLRESTRVFAKLAAFGPWGLTMTASEDPERIPTLAATANFFEVLGIQALHGRTFRAEEGQPGRDRVVVLSHSLWSSRFGGDPRVVGQQLELDGESYRVLGVLPPEFTFPSNHVGFWKPVEVEIDPAERGLRWLHVIGRLAPGASVARARQELAVFSAHLSERYPATHRGWILETAPLHDIVTSEPRRPLIFLQLLVAFLLVMALVNVANLLLAHAESRRYDFAVRSALGASRSAQLAPLLAESLLLCLGGALLGALLAFSGLRSILALVPRSLSAGDFSEVAGHAFARFDQVAIDGRVLGLTLLVLVAATLIFGLVPFFHAQRRDMRQSLAAARDGGFRQRRARRGLVVIQLALALTLLVGAGLLLRSLTATLWVSPGFDARGLLTMQVSVGRVREAPRRSQVLQEILERLAAVPGVEEASLDTALPFTDVDLETEFQPRETENVPDPTFRPQARLHAVDAHYFRTLRIPVRAGRAFGDQDVAGSRRVAIVNETLARVHWPGQNLVGRHIVLSSDQEHTIEIIGIVADIRQKGLDVPVTPEIYTPFTQRPPRTVTLAVRTTGDDPLRFVPDLKALVRQVLPGAPIRNVFPMETLLHQSTASRRFITLITGLFASVAVMLVITGTYAMIAYSTEQRTRELAVRMALGAQRSQIVQIVLGEAFRLSLVGVLLGLMAALFVTRVLKTLLFGVSTTDPLTFIAVPLFLILVTCLAVLPVARRAMRLDSAATLRFE